MKESLFNKVLKTSFMNNTRKFAQFSCQPPDSGESLSSGAPQWPLPGLSLYDEVRGHCIENMAAPRKATVVLKAVKNITVQFCPFESNVRSTR